jgi:hypothetical protein
MDGVPVTALVLVSVALGAVCAMVALTAHLLAERRRERRVHAAAVRALAEAEQRCRELEAANELMACGLSATRRDLLRIRAEHARQSRAGLPVLDDDARARLFADLRDLLEDAAAGEGLP